MIYIDNNILNNMIPSLEAQDELFISVKEFKTVFQTSEDAELWLKLIREELIEFHEELINFGFSDNLLKEYVDILYVFQGFMLLSTRDTGYESRFDGVSWRDWDKVAEELVTTGRLFLSYVQTPDILEGIKRVHASNMSKLDTDGSVLRRADGKVIKGPNYKAPEMTFILDREEILDTFTRKVI